MATRAIGHTVEYYAWDTAAGTYKTGDSANHSLSWVKDGTRSAATNSAAEVDSSNCPGLYKVAITSTETDCNIGTLHGKSSTTGVILVPVTIQFERLPDAAPNATGGVAIVGSAMTLTGGYDAAKGIPRVISAGYIGNLPANLAMQFKFVTIGKGGTLVTLAGTPSLAIYGQSSTNERTGDASLTVDFDGVTGLHHVSLTLTDAFYSSAAPSVANYQVVISAGTIDGVSAVGMVVASFSVGTARSGHVAAMATGSIGNTAMAADAIPAAAIKADAVAKIQSGLALSTDMTTLLSRLSALRAGYLDLLNTGLTLTAGERTAVANEVEAQIIDDTDSEKVLQAITDKIAAVNPSLSGLTLSAIASAIRTELATELARIDAAITTRLAAAGYTAPDNDGITAAKTAAELVADMLPSSDYLAGSENADGSIEAEVDVDTDAIADAVDVKLSAEHGDGDWEGGGGSTVIVTPTVGEVLPRSFGGPITLYVGETTTTSLVVTRSGVPVDLSGVGDLALTIESKGKTLVQTITNGDLDRTLDATGQISFANSSDVTADVQPKRYALRVASSKELIAMGDITVTYAPGA